MGSERPQNLQDTFLNFVRKNKVPLTIFLVNGVKLQGVVTWLTISAFCCAVMGIPSLSISTRYRRSCPGSRYRCSNLAMTSHTAGHRIYFLPTGTSSRVLNV